MPAAEFEEKEFETPLYSQLQQTDLVWSPGQVLEGHVGFDYAALCFDPRIWEMHGVEMPFDGLLLEGLYIDWKRRRARAPRALPNFKLNLFIQAKRPDHIKRVAKRLKHNGIAGPYWRINIYAEQQQMLDSLAAQTHGRGLVCYAAPAFHRLTQLYSHITSSSIVENSTFPEASLLSGHARWNYDRPGNVGVANIEPEFIQGPSLVERLQLLASEHSDQEPEEFFGNLGELARIVKVCVEESYRTQEARSVVFFQRLSAIANVLDSISGPVPDAVQDFLTVQAFCKSFGLRWFTVG
jgi:hypothetical protein